MHTLDGQQVTPSRRLPNRRDTLTAVTAAEHATPDGTGQGATLGTRQRLHALPAAHPAHGLAYRFVLGHGEHTGARWKDRVARLGDVDAMLCPEVVSGARAALRAFQTRFSERLHAEFDVYAPG